MKTSNFWNFPKCYATLNIARNSNALFTKTYELFLSRKQYFFSHQCSNIISNHNFYQLQGGGQKMSINHCHTGATMDACSLNEKRTNYMNQLNAKIQPLGNISELPYSKQRIQLAHFMRAIGKLFLNYFHEDLEAAQQCAKGNKKTLESIHLLAQEYVIDLESKTHGGFEHEYEEWEYICSRRTNIEAFNAMFGNVIEPLNIIELEESMQDAREMGCVSEIPQNVPKSHWWWFV